VTGRREERLMIGGGYWGRVGEVRGM